MRRATAVLLAAVTFATPAALVHTASSRAMRDTSRLSNTAAPRSELLAERWHGERPTTTLAPGPPETVPVVQAPVPTAPAPTTPRTVPDPAPSAGGSVLSVTAYCDAGTMANGQQTYVGAAAGNRWPFGTVLAVEGYGSVVVADRIGSGSSLDIFMPSCAAAEQWGRRSLRVSVV